MKKVKNFKNFIKESLDSNKLITIDDFPKYDNNCAVLKTKTGWVIAINLEILEIMYIYFSSDHHDYLGLYQNDDSKNIYFKDNDTMFDYINQFLIYIKAEKNELYWEQY